MADLSGVTDNYLPTASETFTDNLASSISAGATTVAVNSAAEYSDGQTVVLTVDPGTANEATFVGKKDVGADQFIECVWTEGNTAVGHDAGATIVDYDSATHYNLLSLALQGIMNQDGTLKDTPIRTALGLSEASTNGWEVFPYTFSVASGYNLGGNVYNLTVASQDVTSLLSKGMNLRLERNTTAPTQCANLDDASSQHATLATGSVSGMSFTDDYTLEAWVKPDAYPAAATVVSRRVSSTSGFDMYIDGDGKVYSRGFNGGSTEQAISYASVPLHKWTHLAATHDHSGNAHDIYFNGILVSHTQSGTISAIVQGGPLQIGASNTSNYFSGKICEVRIWEAIRSQTEIQDNMNQQLVGTESNLVGYWKLDGNFDDSTANNNDLAASGGASATDVDNPFSDTQYAKVVDVTYSAPNSTVKVVTGDNNVIPNMTLTSPYYSVQQAPYGLSTDLQRLTSMTYTQKEFQHTKAGSESGVIQDVVYVTPKTDGDMEVSLDADYGFDTAASTIRWDIVIDGTTEVATDTLTAAASVFETSAISWRRPVVAGQTYEVKITYTASDTYFRLRWGVKVG